MDRTLIILILSILADVVSNNSIIQAFEIQTHSSVLLLTAAMLFLQMLAAPIQAGFSDFYCRKKSLITALFCSFISLLFFLYIKSPGLVSLIFLWIGLLLNSCLGNIMPIAWSALAERQTNNLRFLLGVTTSAYAIGYMFLAILRKEVPQSLFKIAWLWQDIFIPLTLLGLSVGLTWKLYHDPKDKKLRRAYHNETPTIAELAQSEFASLSKEMSSQSTRNGMLAYFCWAASQYSLLLLLLSSLDYTLTVVIMMLGYLVGVGILYKCNKISDQYMIRISFIITLSFMFLFLFLTSFDKFNSSIFSMCCFFCTLANSFLSSSIFSLFSKEREFHEQGKGFGLIVSSDSAGFLVGIIAVQIFESSKLEITYMVLFSFLIFLISWFPYSIYEKIRKNAARIGNADQ